MYHMYQMEDLAVLSSGRPRSRSPGPEWISAEARKRAQKFMSKASVEGRITKRRTHVCLMIGRQRDVEGLRQMSLLTIPSAITVPNCTMRTQGGICCFSKRIKHIFRHANVFITLIPVLLRRESVPHRRLVTA